MAYRLQLEDGGFLLLEDGNNLLLEGKLTPAAGEQVISGSMESGDQLLFQTEDTQNIVEKP